MIRKLARFNIYLSVALALAFTAGCQSSHKDKKEKAVALIQLHQEANADGASDSETIPIFREHPIYVNVDKEPFLDSADVTEAKVLEDMGGFVIQLRFNWRGQQILGGVTTANRGRRIAVFCAFSKGKEKESRWLASPQISKPINNGIFTFTPDTTRAEADIIVKGINREAAEIKKKDEF
jgi:preprotein translocase subunit SecD